MGTFGHNDLIANTWEQPFVVRITSHDVLNGWNIYGFVEQEVNPATGTFQDAQTPRVGDTTNSPYLVEMNNLLVPIPTYATVKFRSSVYGETWYTFERCCGVGGSSGDEGSILQWVRIPATLVPAVPASGIQTVTPLDMHGIFPGANLLISDFPDSVGGTPTCPEVVTVISTTSTDFTANFAISHGEVVVYGAPKVLQTTIAGSVVGGGSETVTPASMAGIGVGSQLFITDSLGTTDFITVTDVTSSTFSAYFPVALTGPLTVKGTPNSAMWPGFVCIKDPNSGVFAATGENVWLSPPNGEYLNNQYTDDLENADVGLFYLSAFEWINDDGLQVYIPTVPDREQFVHVVSTTISANITSGTGVEVFPESMFGIFPGISLWVDTPLGNSNPFGDSATGESVVVTSVTAISFVANFANNHTGPTSITGQVTQVPGTSGVHYMYPGVLSQVDAEGFYVDYQGIWLLPTNQGNDTGAGASLDAWKFGVGDGGDSAPLRVYYQAQKQSTISGIPVYLVDTQPDASVNCRGLINTGFQTFIGNKTLLGSLKVGDQTLPSDSSLYVYSSAGPENQLQSGGLLQFAQGSYLAETGVDTTSPSSVSPGIQTVTPVSMVGIGAGQRLLVDGTAGNLGVNGEVVVVISTTGTTFTASFSRSHTAGFTIQGPYTYDMGYTWFIANGGGGYNVNGTVFLGQGYFGLGFVGAIFRIMVDGPDPNVTYWEDGQSGTGGGGDTFLGGICVGLGSGTITIDATPTSGGAAGGILTDDGTKVTELGAGTNGYVLTMISGSPAWAPGGSGTVTSVATTGSLTGGTITTTGTLSLVNDNAAPGNSYYYGTDSGGSKGFFVLPAGTLTIGDPVIGGSGSVLLYEDAGANLAELTPSKSITVVASTLVLVNDVTSPGNSYYYGTDSGGAKGFFVLPSATISIGDTIGAASNYQVLCTNGSGALAEIGPGTSGYVLTTNGGGAFPTWQLPSASVSIGSPVSGGSGSVLLYEDSGANLAELTPAKSITVVSSSLVLVNDATSPGNSYYYGTDSMGAKGWFALPGLSSLNLGMSVTGSGSVGAILYVTQSGQLGGDGSIFSYNSTTGAFFYTHSSYGTIQFGSTNIFQVSVVGGGVDLTWSSAGLRASNGSQVVTVCDGTNNISFAAGNSANWSGGVAPTDVWVALDRLAAAFAANGLILP